MGTIVDPRERAEFDAQVRKTLKVGENGMARNLRVEREEDDRYREFVCGCHCGGNWFCTVEHRDLYFRESGPVYGWRRDPSAR